MYEIKCIFLTNRIIVIYIVIPTRVTHHNPVNSTYFNCDSKTNKYIIIFTFIVFNRYLLLIRALDINQNSILVN